MQGGGTVAHVAEVVFVGAPRLPYAVVAGGAKVGGGGGGVAIEGGAQWGLPGLCEARVLGLGGGGTGDMVVPEGPEPHLDAGGSESSHDITLPTVLQDGDKAVELLVWGGEGEEGRRGEGEEGRREKGRRGGGEKGGGEKGGGEEKERKGGAKEKGREEEGGKGTISYHKHKGIHSLSSTHAQEWTRTETGNNRAN